MKKLLLYLLLITLTLVVRSQTSYESFLTQYKKATSFKEKSIAIREYLDNLKIPLTEKISISFKLIDQFYEQNDATGMGYVQLKMGGYWGMLGDYTNYLKSELSSLKNFEKTSDTIGIANSSIQIGASLLYSQNFEQALPYFKKSVSIEETQAHDISYADALNATADCLIRMKRADSALAYIQEAVKIGYEQKDTLSLAYYVGTLGQAYLIRTDYDIAKSFFLQSSQYAKKFDDGLVLAANGNDISHIYFEKMMYDSTIKYAKEASYYAEGNDKLALMSSYEWIYKSFEKKNMQDSVAKYFRLAMNTKDTLFSIEKNRNIQAMNFQEQIRQQEKEAEQIKIKKERKENIQYTLIGLSLITFMLFFLLLSRSFIINSNLIRFFGILGLLLVFEFINLLLHPFLERVTGHTPVLMLLSLVIVAAFLIPLHHILEKKAIHKLIEKNKEIRWASAKKTIK
ncbi:MAG: tetratricopeptide repeat protein [Flavobacterium sp.]